ncbi:MAG: response regulator [Gammaproteobacteria bacterium]|nr:response regulator [Gammaproteobacteria bacterium]
MNEHNILIVDDDLSLNAILGLHLQEAGYRIAGARTCREALYLLQDRPFSAALLDYCLPDGTGLDVLRAAREAAPTMGVIMISGVHDAAVRRAALEGGAIDLLRKPISLMELDAALARLAEGLSMADGPLPNYQPQTAG